MSIRNLRTTRPVRQNSLDASGVGPNRGKLRSGWLRAQSLIVLFLLAASPLLSAGGCEPERDGLDPEEVEISTEPRFAGVPMPGAPDYSEPSSPSASPGLRTEGNRIVGPDGSTWIGRGVNIHDTRSCNACTGEAPNAEEVKRRVDEAVDVWGADFLRLNMESYGREGENCAPITEDGDYLDDIVEIVDHIGTKPGVYVLLSLWHDPTFTSLGWPTAATADTWEILTIALQGRPHVIFGLVNEPQANNDGALDANVWQAMNDTVARIRSVEQALSLPSRVIAVQGTRGWARDLSYYVRHPIEAGGGENIVYETHVYNTASEFEALFETPGSTLPVIIGEFGPFQASSMGLADTAELMERAETAGVPYLAWTFHQRCPPNLLVDYSNESCGVDMPLEPTEWGLQLIERLSVPAAGY